MTAADLPEGLQAAYAQLEHCLTASVAPSAWLAAGTALEQALAALPPPSSYDDVQILQEALRRHREFIQLMREKMDQQQRAQQTRTQVRQRYTSDNDNTGRFVDRQT